MGGKAVVYAPIERSMANKNLKRTVEGKNGSRGGVSGRWLGARKGRWLIGLLRLPNCCHTRDLGRSTTLYHKFGSIPLQGRGQHRWTYFAPSPHS